MLPDGTIALQLRDEHKAALGDAYFELKPGDPRYKEVLGHIGGLRPGESKLVPPWELKK